MLQILLNDERRPSRQPQHQLNSNMQEAIKKEVVKLLQWSLVGTCALIIKNSVMSLGRTIFLFPSLIKIWDS